MSVRAYVILNLVEGSSEYVVDMLRGRKGVVSADWIEGRNDIIAIVEAPDRQKLADAMMPVIGYVDGITEDLHLMVSRDWKSGAMIPEFLGAVSPVSV